MEWLQEVIALLTKEGVVLNGKINWSGEDCNDLGILELVDSELYVYSANEEGDLWAVLYYDENGALELKTMRTSEEAYNFQNSEVPRDSEIFIGLVSNLVSNLK